MTSPSTNGAPFPATVPAAAYWFAGFGQPTIRLRSRSKAPYYQGGGPPVSDDPATFTEADNIGLLNGAPGGNGIDLDLDSGEAVRAADHLLPSTDAIYGRRSARRSHRRYRTDSPPEKASDPFVDPTLEPHSPDRLLLELRSTGGQSMAPPSIHPDGERVEFDLCGEPAAVPFAELARAARETAAAALIGRYWPTSARHFAALALAGGLLRAGLTATRAETFIRAVCAVAGDDEVQNRVACVADTEKRLKDNRNKHASGWPKLGELLGQRGNAVVAAVRGWIDTEPRPTMGGSAGQPTSPARYVPLPDWRPFPLDCLPEPWGEFARQGANAIRCDPAFVAFPILSVLASAVGNTRRVYVGPEWYEPAVIWTCVIGESGTVKTPAADLSVNLVKARQKRLMAEYRARVKEHERDQAERTAARKPGKSGKTSDDGDPAPPVPGRVLVGDTTIEKLAGLLDDNRRGVLLYRDELAGWLGSFRRYKGKSGGTDEPNWLSIHRADSIVYDRKSGDKPSVYVPHAAVSIAGSIQPKTLARLLGQESFDSGLAARVVFAFPPRSPKTWSDDTVSEKVRAAAEASLARLYDLSAETDADGDPRPVLVKFSGPARERFKRFVNEWGRRTFQVDDELAAALAKLEGLAARFALVHHVVTRAAALEDADPIGLASVEAGIELAEWAADEAERVYMMLAESDQEREVRRLVDLVRRIADRNGGRVTVKQLQRANQRKYRVREDAEAELTRLIGFGLGRWEEVPPGRTGGRPTRAFVLCVPRDGSDQTPDDDDSDDGGGVRDETPDPQSGGGSDRGGTTPNEPTPSGESSKAGGGVWSEPSRVTHKDSAEARAPESPERPPGGFVTHPASVYITSPAALPLTAIEESVTVGLDIETTGLDTRTDRVRLLSLSLETCDGGRVSYLIDLFALPAEALPPLWEALAEKLLVGFNFLFDLRFLAPLGFVPGRVWDAMLASQVLHAGERDPNNAPLRHALADVARRHLGETIDKEEQASDWSAATLTPAQLEYAAADAEQPVRLREALLPKLGATKLLPVADLEMRTLPCVVWASTAGVAVDRVAWEQLATEAEAEATRLREALDAAAPDASALFGARNWNSPEQVKAAFAAAGIALESTADDTLAAVDHPLADLLRDYRGAAKRAGTYGRAWLDHVAPDGRVYAAWKPIGAGASGRMSCTTPNLQNLPRDERYRRCFVAPPGRVFIKADYSQIELRLAAKIASDRAMQDAYRREEDLHVRTARAVLGTAEVGKPDRQVAKAINFGLLYGMGVPAFRRYALANFGVRLTTAEAEHYRQTFFAAYPGLRAWHTAQPDRPTTTRTVLGRRRVRVTRFSEKLNTPVQGTGADGLKAAMALLWERRADCPSALPVLFVHDEIVVECDAADAERAKAWLTRAMMDGMTPFADPVPVAVEAAVLRTWGGDPAADPRAARVREDVNAAAGRPVLVRGSEVRAPDRPPARAVGDFSGDGAGGPGRDG
jgi:DNA polymerase I-like protein with 3'-5' exonuclease and polymerase domains